MHTIAMQDLPESLVAHGSYTASRNELRELTGLSDATIASGLSGCVRGGRCSLRRVDCMS